MSIDEYTNTKCEYKIMAKCRLCGEIFDGFNGENALVLTPKDAEMHLMYPSAYQMNDLKYIHRHKDGSYGIGDIAGLYYKGEWKE